eukprot:TRINITY_DN5787_c0_g1_i1.p1 TRINITY_DN5787_c0_g1~~TRINITY_DN5787_c0_g1_i1.p1  ORF type:complete len:148 (+),score=17.26 TRINITY_DN5787_c0_g1_i1:2-445(+)
MKRRREDEDEGQGISSEMYPEENETLMREVRAARALGSIPELVEQCTASSLPEDRCKAALALSTLAIYNPANQGEMMHEVMPILNALTGYIISFDDSLRAPAAALLNCLATNDVHGEFSPATKDALERMNLSVRAKQLASLPQGLAV